MKGITSVLWKTERARIGKEFASLKESVNVIANYLTEKPKSVDFGAGDSEVIYSIYFSIEIVKYAKLKRLI